MTTGSFTIATFLALLLLPYYAAAFSFSISSRVVQCANLSITWDGGVAPWNIVLIPVGALASGPEIRTIVDVNVTTGNTYAFQLKFPTNSSFLAMMSDATGVGTGGTSVLISVLDGDNSCLATSATSPAFYFYLDPATGNPSQCGTWGVSWDAGNAQPPVRITAMIPGGQTFSLPVPSSGSSFDWTVDVRQNTQFLLVGGDSRGFGTGGSTNLYTVQSGGSSCIDAATPSSTAAPAAGGVYATGSGGGTVTGIPGGGPNATGSPSTGSSGTGSSDPNIGAIVGGVIGGVAGLIIIGLILLFFWRRRRLHKQGAPSKGRRGRSVDLLHGDSAGTPGGITAAGVAGTAATNGDDRPMSQTDAFGRPSVSSIGARTDNTGGPILGQSRRGSAPSLPAMTFGSDDGAHSASTHQPFAVGSPTAGRGSFPPSAFPAAPAGRPGTPTGTETSVRTPATSAPRRDSKAGGMPTLRPVNIIQHDDAGAVPGASGGVAGGDEVVELPPSYQDVRRTSGLGVRPDVETRG